MNSLLTIRKNGIIKCAFPVYQISQVQPGFFPLGGLPTVPSASNQKLLMRCISCRFIRMPISLPILFSL